ncbi:uncharacterized protein LOC120644144 [Panicum virgatum]|uniref:Uncharacterized protein n=1 Tax=Panicum virgatum TaxID=38727 RepID=A0A8T0PLP3_PANVG|nr:uncharacterized protein LOC120644144 [Panicum virgatum]KAG2561519.1 hypothetical protein PVAP13_8KG165401 [Panicum virgatum]
MLTETQLCGCLAASHNMLEASEVKVEELRRCLIEAKAWAIELWMELELLCDAADVVAEHLHARGGSYEERLLDIPASIRAVTVFGVHHGASVALAAAQARMGHRLDHLTKVPVGIRRANEEAFIKIFARSTNTVVAKVLWGLRSLASRIVFEAGHAKGHERLYGLAILERGYSRMAESGGHPCLRSLGSFFPTFLMLVPYLGNVI